MSLLSDKVTLSGRLWQRTRLHLLVQFDEVLRRRG